MTVRERKAVNDCVTSVKENLGGRKNGYIGHTEIDTAIINILQETQTRILQKYNPLSLEGYVTLDIDDTGRLAYWDLTDLAGDIAAPKSVVDVRCRADGEDTGTRLLPITEATRTRMFPEGAEYEEVPGIPKYFVVRKSSTGALGLELYPYPDGTYELTAKVNFYPADVEAHGTMGIDMEWIPYLEALATSTCFYKLQELQSGEFWKVQAQRLLSSTQSAENIQRTKQYQAVNNSPASPIDSGSDPYVRNNEAPQW